MFVKKNVKGVLEGNSLNYIVNMVCKIKNICNNDRCIFIVFGMRCG